MIKNEINNISFYTARNKIGEEVIVQIRACKIINNDVVYLDSFIKQNIPILSSTLPKHISYEMLQFAPSSYVIAKEIVTFIEDTDISPDEKIIKFLSKNKIKLKNR